jgi:TRAP-type C4-dicarboxylate transport system permease small subunit
VKTLVAAMRRTRAVLVKALELVLVFGFALLFLDVVWGVVSRYVLGHQSRWTEELAIYLLIWISLLGAAVTYEKKGHLGVDYFVGKMDRAAQRLAAVMVELFVAAFAGFALVYGGIELVGKTLASGQVSPALDWPMGYVYLAAPISGVFFLVFCIENLADLAGGRAPVEQTTVSTDV